ncbi:MULTISPECIES: Dps family protein [Thermomonospora]|uniref:Ferritin Dps family protein n=1 Tax=Thermomonospora curvata (strain ATCC 19995 / DSM 43183 / JCM 3096 / KCTC 9072 / NBRC 15933 / NCIMB 10081 / Henssen B9) TaxID=471852 RepID=D1AAC7_THECD|nr:MULTISPECIES: DNA starvation/stationary phase protection protein [Thermomonospora]ACY98840.1 Ferritin Dps family protein [Thermomonospora curvata DSM 43183]PKK13385.1 MAG: DNA starvation/stationary phase protection protein [Thermomonospora sp. CIF 1]
MATVMSPLRDETARRTTGEALQGALVDLLDLSLVAKQYHWNLTGPRFRSVHLQLDDVVSLARKAADRVAERAVAVGVNPDGRVRTVADTTKIRQPDGGYESDDKVVASMTDILAQIIARFRERIEATGRTDLVTQDMLIGITADLEKQHWMFEVQTQ